MSNLYLSGVTRVEIIHSKKCNSCGGSGVIHIATESSPMECPDCHGLGGRGREVISHAGNEALVVQLQDQNRTLKIFMEDKE